MYKRVVELKPNDETAKNKIQKLKSIISPELSK